LSPLLIQIPSYTSYNGLTNDSHPPRNRFHIDCIKNALIGGIGSEWHCRSAVGPDFPIILRFSQWKSSDYAVRLAETPEEWQVFLEPLSKAGVDNFHVSTRRYWSELISAGQTNALRAYDSDVLKLGGK
jgi:hypothetical protein